MCVCVCVCVCARANVPARILATRGRAQGMKLRRDAFDCVAGTAGGSEKCLLVK